MDISILTLHGANNVGAFLQAYSLQCVLSKFRSVRSVSFIRFPSQGAANNKINKAIGYLKQREIGKVIFKYKSSKKYTQVEKYLNLDTEIYSQDRQYDVVVIGSDEVWNITSNNFIHRSQYFGKDLRANRIVSYAASGNSTTPSDLVKSGMDFSSLSFISVRDEKTYDLVYTISGRRPVLVCDPTILIDNFDDEICQINRTGFILVYSYELGKKEISEIKSFAKTQKKKLISVGTYNSWCDENIVADPFEFLGWLKAADYVITSTFHGCVLSVKLQKEFAIYTHSEGNPVNHKIMDFLVRTELQNRDGATYDLSSIFNQKIDYSEINETIHRYRQESLKYLKEALSIND